MITKNREKPIEIKALIDAGQYVPSPEAVAAAMLKRPGLCLLFGLSPAAAPTGQSR